MSLEAKLQHFHHYVSNQNLPLEAINDFLVSADNEKIPTNNVFAKCNGLCLRGFE